MAKICVISGNRASEPHTFTYTPVNQTNSNNTPLALTVNTNIAHAASNPPKKDLKNDGSLNSDPDAGIYMISFQRVLIAAEVIIKKKKNVF